MLIINVQSKFRLGLIAITPNALDSLSPEAVNEALRRHANCDWGDLSPEDARLNDEALQDGSRLVSTYGDGDTRFWIITEADRSVTTILLPEDY